MKKNPYINRELSWLEFNARVLSEAEQSDVPLLERLKFLGIVASNFDEFFMVRVGTLRQLAEENNICDISGFTAEEQLDQIAKRVNEILTRRQDILHTQLLPGLAKNNLVYVKSAHYSIKQTKFLNHYFMHSVLPLLTPRRFISESAAASVVTGKLHVAFLLKRNNAAGTAYVQKELSGNIRPVAIIQLPSSLERIIFLPDDAGRRVFALLDDIIRLFADKLFPGYTVVTSITFKINRSAEFPIDESRDHDFIDTLQEVLRWRESAFLVNMICSNESDILITHLQHIFRLSSRDVYILDPPIGLAEFARLADTPGFYSLKYTAWKNFWPSDLPRNAPFWDEIKKRDILLHVPYQSYEPVVNFINHAADDADVLAIKMTLYRTSGDSPVISALERAAANGTHVTVFVELKARFDEARNIEWKKRLSNAGVVVIYGLVNFKVHAKILLVIRRELGRITRYVHLATGNYNDKTAKLYSDLSLFTANEEFADDAVLIFNMISGYSSIMSTKQITMSPVDLKQKLLNLIKREIGRSDGNKPGRIIAKMNSLSDPEIIDALYEASKAGVIIKLNIRGICMLVPGIPNLSETISVTSIIGRYLEHSRIFYFENGGAGEVYLSSADWMTRNLDRRVELLFPLLQSKLCKQVKSMLDVYFTDNYKAHDLNDQGAWTRRTPRTQIIHAQQIFYDEEKEKSLRAEKQPEREFIVRRHDERM